MNPTNFSLTLGRLIDIGMKFTGILILGFAYILTVNGQEQKNAQPQDSSKNKSHYYSRELILTQPPLLPAHSYGDTQQNFSSFLHQSHTVPMPPFSWTYTTKIDLESAWKQELAKQDEYRTLRTILGSVNMGGAAYLTYLHLKKYGLK